MNETKQTEAAAPEGRLDALVGRVEALMRDSQFGGDHRRVTARKVCGLFYAEIERAETDVDRHCENALRLLSESKRLHESASYWSGEARKYQRLYDELRSAPNKGVRPNQCDQCEDSGFSPT